MKISMISACVLGALLFTGSASSASFFPEDQPCSIRYMVVVKNMPENHPLRENYETRFFHSLDQFGEKFPHEDHDDVVLMTNSGAQSLYEEIASGQLAPDGFWDQVIACDVEYGFPKTVKP